MDKEFIDAFLDASGYAASTEESYRYALTRFADWLSENLITIDELTVKQYKIFLDGHNWSSNMKRMYAAAIRAFLRWFGYQEHLIFTVKLPKDEGKPGRALEIGELDKLLATFDTTTPGGWRNVAAISLMAETGLRITEICRAKLRDLDLARHKLTVMVKRRKWREAKFSAETAMYLAKWLEMRPSVAKKDCLYLFVSVGGKRRGTQLTRHGMRANFQDFGAHANIGRLSPHDMRRTMACLLTDAGASAETVRRQGDWTDIRMVQRYTRNLKPRPVDQYSPITRLAREIGHIDS